MSTVVQEQAFPDLKLDLDHDSGLAILAIDRPKALNALNSSILEQLEAAIGLLEGKPEIRVLILTGAGDKAFVAGADISELKELSQQQGKRASRRGQRLFSQIEESRLLVIAAINGFALGGGLELAMACDFRVLSEKAIVGLPEVSLGIIPGYGGTQRLTRIVGADRALELIATGRKIDAAAALSMGIAHRVVAPEELMPQCKSLAMEILANAPLAVSAAKRAVRGAIDACGEEGYYLEAAEFAKLCTSSDAMEGMTAFFERRKPRFQGR